MRPEARQRLRRITVGLAVGWALLAVILSLAGQLLAPDGLRTPIDTTGTADVVIVQWRDPSASAAGVGNGDRLLAVDGTPVLRWFRERGWQRLAEGVANRYELERPDGMRYVVSLPPVPEDMSHRLVVPLYVAIIAVGAAYLAIGLVVWRLRPDRDESWAFTLFTSTLAMTLFSSMQTFDALFGYERSLINFPFLAAAMLHLFTTYPFEPRWVVRRPGIRFVPYAAAVLFVPFVLLEAPLGIPPNLLPRVGFGCIMASALASMGILAVERWRNRGSDRAARADVIVLGAMLSFLPVVALLFVLVFVWRASFPFPFAFALLWFVIFPLAIGYGIVRRELFEIRLVARSSMAYGAATLAITGFYALLITSAQGLVSRFNLDARAPVFSVAFLFIAILAFNPLRHRLQSLVDRVFDRDRAGYRSAVREISEAMVSMLSLQEIGDRLLSATASSMGVERAMVLLLDADERRLRPFAHCGEWEPSLLGDGVAADHPVTKHLWMRRQELVRHDFDDELDPQQRESCHDLYDSLEVAMLVPVLFGVDLLGVIAVGSRMSGERLTLDDRQLLRTLANQSAIAIENAKAFDEISKLNETLEARVELRTRELEDTQTQLMQSEKMRSLGQLVAGVAHELNNPIGFVHANLQLLDGFLLKLTAPETPPEETGKAREAIQKLLRRSREGTERVKKIVEDLRSFSRMDQAEIQEVDLNEEIARTLTLMEPRLKDRIAVAREFGELPRVRCFASQLNQVFMNLLMNACDVLEDGGTIRVRTARADSGVLLEFADDGPGIPESVVSRIFEPFFTTKPVGKGTGLGLSISHGIVERHGGRMEVDSALGAGTTFRIHLPIEAMPTAVAGR